jgi:hypothetical protein
MYAFRKPFTAADYVGDPIIAIQPKILFVICQVIGYTVSKFSGIVIISTVNKSYRGLSILVCLFVAELALLGFGAVPMKWKPLFMFINGLPLGLIWGLVFSFIEGRETSEFLATGMCISFIIASGASKAVGAALMAEPLRVSEYWMPALTGAIFFPILIVGTYLLELLPEPSIRDVELRTKRVSMSHADRVKMLVTFWPGITVMTLFYMLLTAIRDFRDNFAPELWQAFGVGTPPTIFAVTEIVVGVVVMIPIVLFMVFIKNHMKTLVAYHILIFGGMIVVAGSALIQRVHPSQTTGKIEMIGTGIGLYFAYVPFSQIIWDLMLATFQYPATSGFLMYVCDSLGYLSSVAVILVKNFTDGNKWDLFYFWMCMSMAIIGAACMTVSLIYYIYKHKTWVPPHVDLCDPGLLSLRSRAEE